MTEKRERGREKYIYRERIREIMIEKVVKIYPV